MNDRIAALPFEGESDDARRHRGIGWGPERNFIEIEIWVDRRAVRVNPLDSVDKPGVVRGDFENVVVFG